jgi:hypothetical protein
MSESFYVNLNLSDSFVPEMTILKYHMQEEFSPLWPHPTPGGHEFNKHNFVLHVRKLSC